DWNTMARPRSAAPFWVTSSPSISMPPEVGLSSPAMRRRSVDLPQPEGPTKTTSSPSLISRSTPWITSTASNDFRMFLSAMRPMRPLLFDARAGYAGGDEALQKDEHQDNWDHGNHG